jgi:peptidoglycan hydrolase-like amidase
MKDKFYINNIEFNTLYFADDNAITANSKDYLETSYIYI